MFPPANALVLKILYSILAQRALFSGSIILFAAKA
jgi:hypothetical protein